MTDTKEPEFEPIPVQGTLTHKAYCQLRAAILKGELLPGKKLKIEELRKNVGTGASPIREALSRLTSDGLVDRIDQRGFRVASISQEEFDDLLKARCWLEERALRESIALGEAKWEEDLVLSFYRLNRLPRATGDDKFATNMEWEKRHKEFHMALIAACGSSILLGYCDELYDKNIRYRNMTESVAYPSRNVTEEHEGILNATVDRNADLAVKRLLDHYKNTGSLLRSTLAVMNRDHRPSQKKSLSD